MTLPVSGNPIKMSQVNVELGLSSTAQLNLSAALVRTLFGVASGQIKMSDGYGKSDRVSISHTFTSTTTNASLNVTSISGYITGKSDITITVNGGVYLYATSTGNAGLSLSGGSSADTLTLVNNGFIMGQGGTGGQLSAGSAGGPALSLGFATTVNNTNGSAYIAGGGGGGAGSAWYPDGAPGGGGGGAGGGSSGGGWTIANTNTGGEQGGGGPGSAGGTNGGGANAGGGGGRILPGSGGSAGQSFRLGFTPGGGGGSGGGGGGGTSRRAGTAAVGGTGGSGSAGGANGSPGMGSGGGGGGGWGASGGSGGNGNGGGAGGKAVNLNGYSITWTSGNTSRVYGSVS